MYLLAILLAFSVSSEAIPVEVGDWCPEAGVLLPTEQAAELAAGYAACRETVLLERAHAGDLEQAYQQALVTIDEAAAKALEECVVPSPWLNGWVWTGIIGAAAAGLVAGVVLTL